MRFFSSSLFLTSALVLAACSGSKSEPSAPTESPVGGDIPAPKSSVSEDKLTTAPSGVMSQLDADLQKNWGRFSSTAQLADATTASDTTPSSCDQALAFVKSSYDKLMAETQKRAKEIASPDLLKKEGVTKGTPDAGFGLRLDFKTTSLTGSVQLGATDTTTHIKQDVKFTASLGGDTPKPALRAGSALTLTTSVQGLAYADSAKKLIQSDHAVNVVMLTQNGDKTTSIETQSRHEGKVQGGELPQLDLKSKVDVKTTGSANSSGSTTLSFSSKLLDKDTMQVQMDSNATLDGKTTTVKWAFKLVLKNNVCTIEKF